jgi:hypothetical protein
VEPRSLHSNSKTKSPYQQAPNSLHDAEKRCLQVPPCHSLPNPTQETDTIPLTALDLDYLFYSTSLFNFIDFSNLFGFGRDEWYFDPLCAEIIFDDQF